MSKPPYSKLQLKSVYKDLFGTTSKISPQKRGYLFEHILYSILFHEKLEPLSSYNTKGEQIDGSFFWNGQTFLLEAKWQKESLPVSSIYSFKGKVDGKFHTTSGIFISMSGYSPDVPDALRYGKIQNILLFDQSDIDFIINEGVSFAKILKFKIRQASDTGEPYVPYSSTKEVKSILSDTPVYSPNRKTKSNSLFIIFCEGKADYDVLLQLFKRLNFSEKVAFQIRLLGGSGNLVNKISYISDLVAKRRGKFDLRGIIAILNNDEPGRIAKKRFEDLTAEVIGRNSITIPAKVLNVDQYNLLETANTNLTPDNITASWLKDLVSFINNALPDSYDPEWEAADKAVARVFKDIEWDFEEQSIYVPGERKVSEAETFRSINEFRFYLEEIAEGAADSVSSWDQEYLADRDYDFSDIVNDYLEEHVVEIGKLGWIL
jgi:hypothetical protein